MTGQDGNNLLLTYIWNVSHPALAVSSYSSGPLAARTVGTKSMGGFYQAGMSPCSISQFKETGDTAEFQHYMRSYQLPLLQSELFEIG